MALLVTRGSRLTSVGDGSLTGRPPAGVAVGGAVGVAGPLTEAPGGGTGGVVLAGAGRTEGLESSPGDAYTAWQETETRSTSSADATTAAERLKPRVQARG